MAYYETKLISALCTLLPDILVKHIALVFNEVVLLAVSLSTKILFFFLSFQILRNASCGVIGILTHDYATETFHTVTAHLF